MSYTLGDPVNNGDPDGLCDVFIAGITQSAANSPYFESDATAAGAISVYPYSNSSDRTDLVSMVGSYLGSIAQVALQAYGAQSSTYSAVVGLLLAAKDGDPINVTTWSGGAAALTAAVSWLNGQGDAGQSVVSMISSITYLGPGAGTPLANVGNVTVINGGFGNALAGALTDIPQGATVLAMPNCGHDFACLYDPNSGHLPSGSPCSTQYTVNQPGTYFMSPTYNQWSGRWTTLDLINAIGKLGTGSPVPIPGGLPFVTSRILPP